MDLDLTDRKINELPEKELAERIEQLDGVVYQTANGKKSLRADYHAKDLLLLSKLRQRASKIESDKRKAAFEVELKAENERRAEHQRIMRSIAIRSGAKRVW